MAQSSIESYFATRKRSAVDEANIARAKKVLILDPAENIKGSRGVNRQTQSEMCDVVYANNKETSLNNNFLGNDKLKCVTDRELKFPQRNRVITKLNFDSVKTNTPNMTIKKTATSKGRPRKNTKEIPNQQNIQSLFLNMHSKNSEDGGNQEKVLQSKTNIQKLNEKTPPVSPVNNAMDNISKSNDLSLNEIKTKLTRSSRLAELKASIAKFNKSANKLKEVEKKTTVPALKTFKSIELEVQLSPKKTHPSTKPYLSPKKGLLSPRKNILGLSNPSKSPLTSPVKVPAYQRFQTLSSPGKPSLTLPYKYRSLAEIFRSIDTVCAMLFNRKETITFNKVKPAVQEMMRRNITFEHFAQIKALYPDAFNFNWEKIRNFASVSRQENYELIIIPILNGEEEAAMNPTCLLNRRRKLFAALIEKVKDYHSEFLASLDPVMSIAHDKITRWHPEFDIEKIPDIESSELPKKPEEEKMTSGQEVLEKARSLFNCNTRMEKALERLKQMQGKKPIEEVKPVASAPIPSALKGIPKALLEKVRAKQAAKALEAMTRSASQDKESLMYSRLPEFARLMRSTYVAEKKGVLPLEEVIIKLNNSYRSFLTNSEIEEHLRLLSKVVPGWIVFHEVRRTLFVKLSRDGDMHKVMSKLEELLKEKCGT